MTTPSSGDCPALARLRADMQAALRAGDKARLVVVRMAIAEAQRAAIDGQQALQDADVLAILDKMVKQRRDSSEQFRAGGRDDLADKEDAESVVLRTFMPEPLTDTELSALIDRVVAQVDAGSAKDMGRVMGALRPLVQGRADMRSVSVQVRKRLS